MRDAAPDSHRDPNSSLLTKVGTRDVNDTTNETNAANMMLISDSEGNIIFIAHVSSDSIVTFGSKSLLLCTFALPVELKMRVTYDVSNLLMLSDKVIGAN